MERLTDEQIRQLCTGIAASVDRLNKGETETIAVELARATVPGFIMTTDARLWAELRAHFAGYKQRKALNFMTPYAPAPAAPAPAPTAAPQSAPLDSLNRFPRLTRAIYLQLTGKQAPAYNPGAPIQRWADPAGLAGTYEDIGGQPMYTYGAWAHDPATNSVRYLERSIPAKEARAPNLPGAYVYPAYDVTDSGLFIALYDIQGTEIQRQYADKFMLSNRAQAEEEAEIISRVPDIGPVLIEDAAAAMQYPYEYKREPKETRSIFQLIIGGTPWNVGSLLKNRHAAGMGAPGHYVRNTVTGGPQWITEVPTVVSEYNPLPETPCPQRPLADTEEIHVPLFGAPFVRVKAAPTPAAPTSDLSSVLSRMLDLLEQIYKQTRPAA